jgi:multidrug resistance efflux pump
MKSENKMTSLLRILSLTKEYYPIIIIYSICISILTLATPISVQSLVSTVSFGPYFQPLFLLSLILLSLLLVLGVLKSLQYLMVEHLQRKLYAKITAHIYGAYQSDADLTKQGAAYGNRYFDIIILQKTLAYLVTDGVAIFLQVSLGLILISLYHPYFIIFSILICISIFIPLYIFINSGMRSAVDESKNKYRVADFIITLSEQKLETLPTAKDADTEINNFLESRSQHFRILFIQNILYIGLYAFLNATLLALGGYLVISNQISVGQLVASEIVVNTILARFLYAQKYLESFYDLYAACEKIDIFYLRHISDEKQLRSFSSVRSVYTPYNYKKFFRNFSIGLLLVVILLAVMPWQQTSSGNGKVIALDPNDRSQYITATLPGRIEEWLVKDGQLVKAGDPIVRIVDNDPNYMGRLEGRRDAGFKKLEAAVVASDTAKLNYIRQEKLMKEGLSARKDYESALITYKKLRAEEAAAAADLAKLEVDLSRQQLQTILAPRDGRILRILHGSGTINVKAGDQLAQFVPETEKLVVELFIDGNDFPLIYVGRQVRLQFEGWPSIQFSGWPSVAVGSFSGRVEVVDPSVGENGLFRVLVSPDDDDEAEAEDHDDDDWPDKTFLRQGTRALGLVLLDQVSVGYELWRKVNGFPKSMRNAPIKNKVLDDDKND